MSPTPASLGLKVEIGAGLFLVFVDLEGLSPISAEMLGRNDVVAGLHIREFEFAVTIRFRLFWHIVLVGFGFGENDRQFGLGPSAALDDTDNRRQDVRSARLTSIFREDGKLLLLAHGDSRRRLNFRTNDELPKFVGRDDEVFLRNPRLF